MKHEKFTYKSLDEIKAKAAELGVHLPFAEDDTYGYRKMLQREMEKGSLPENIHILSEPLQTISFTI